MEKKKRFRIWTVVAAVMVLAAVILPVIRAEAAEKSLVIKEIDYDADTLTLEADGDTGIFVSNKSMKTWDEMFGTWLPDGKTFVMDISWISKSTNYELAVKGNVSETPVRVTIPKQVTVLKVKMDYLNNKLVYTNAGNRTIQWRKRNTTTWHDTGTSDPQIAALMNELESFYAKGTYIYFRLGAQNGQIINGAFEPGLRPGREVKLTITKRTNGPAVVLNTAKESVTSVKSTIAYRIQGSTVWNDIVSGKTSLNLREAAPQLFAQYDADGLVNVQGEDVVLEFKTKGTSSKMESKITALSVLGQMDAPPNVEFDFTSPTTLLITVPEMTAGSDTYPKASTKYPYEYTIIKGDSAAPADDAVWKPITSSLGATVTSGAAPKGYIICVRLKAYSDSKEKRLASAYIQHEVGLYPSNSVISENDAAADNSGVTVDADGVLHLEKMAGVPDAGNLSFVITMAAGMATDVKGIACNKAAITFHTTVSGQAITVTLDSTEKVEASTTKRGEPLPITITLKNGEVLNDMADITIATGPAIIGKKAFVLMRGQAIVDDLSFEVTPGVDLGGNDTDVSEITCAGISLNYSTAVQADGSIKVTLDSTDVEALYTSGVTADIAQNVQIGFDNGAILNGAVTITITNPAKYMGAQSYVLSKREGTNVTDRTTLKLSLSKASLSISKVTWRGVDIMGNASVQDNILTIDLDNDSINALTLRPGETSYQEFIKVEFSNGTFVQEAYAIKLLQ